MLLRIRKAAMIDIYKKLPGTNCGRCGVGTCMAFALKVSKSLASLSACPFMPGEVTQGTPPAPGRAAEGTFERVSLSLEKEAVRVDFRETAGAVGGTYETNNGKEAIRLTMINKTYEMRREGLFQDGVYSTDAWAKIIVYDYVRRKGTKPLTGDWITLGHFQHTASHAKAFQNNAEKKIAAAFKANLDGLKKRCAEFGGAEIEGKIKADYFCRIDLLPRVPLYLSFWQADEEFDEDCKLLFDSNAEDHLDIEYLAYLVERFVEELVN